MCIFNLIVIFNLVFQLSFLFIKTVKDLNQVSTTFIINVYINYQILDIDVIFVVPFKITKQKLRFVFHDHNQKESQGIIKIHWFY